MDKRRVLRDYLDGKLSESEARDRWRQVRGKPPYDPRECCGGRCQPEMTAEGKAVR